MSSSFPTPARHRSKSSWIKNRWAIFAIACGVFLVSLGTSQTCSADENSVLEYLSNTDSTAYLQQGDFRIELESARENLKNSNLKGVNLKSSFVFQKFINDIPLHGGRVVVFENVDGDVGEVFDDSSELLNLDFAQPTLQAEAAEELIEEEVANVIDSETKLVWFRIGVRRFSHGKSPQVLPTLARQLPLPDWKLWSTQPQAKSFLSVN